MQINRMCKNEFSLYLLTKLTCVQCKFFICSLGNFIIVSEKFFTSLFTLISTGSKTHAQGSESKFTTLEFSKLNNDQLQIEIPEDRNEIQNGTYMLFVVNNSGVPSQGKIVNIN